MMITTGHELRSEAAIWAEGTEYSTDEIIRLYREHCEATGEDISVAAFCERELGIASGTALTATWDGSEYACGEWRSADGDEWLDAAGLPVTGHEFTSATIRLAGGPRNGETVA